MRYRLILVTILIFTVALLLAACGSQQEAPAQTAASVAQVDDSEHEMETIHVEGAEHEADEHEEEDVHKESDDHDADEHEEEAAHEEGDEHAMDVHDEQGEDHGAGAHGIPEDAAAVPNPVTAGAASVEAGEAIYSATCAVCHGETGLGDGAGGAAMDPKPANLHEDHVQVLSDGALFYTIHNGVEGTGMPAWGESLSEEDIWNVVNFIRTYQE